MERTVKICFLAATGILGLLIFFALGHIRGGSHYRKSLKHREHVKKAKRDKKGGM